VGVFGGGGFLGGGGGGVGGGGGGVWGWGGGVLVLLGLGGVFGGGVWGGGGGGGVGGFLGRKFLEARRMGKRRCMRMERSRRKKDMQYESTKVKGQGKERSGCHLELRKD